MSGAASSRFHKAKQRRAERAPLTAHGSINLVPLVDVLTAIVFFSLLTYTGAVMSTLTAFDLQLPPVVVTAEQAKTNAGQKDTLTLILAVKMADGKLSVEHSGGAGGAPFRQVIGSTNGAALDTLQTVLAQIKQQFPDNNDVLLVPDDAVPYDDIVHVLERIKLARFGGISIGSRERATQVAAVNGGRN
jgi:biopolymer transport protein ExbD